MLPPERYPPVLYDLWGPQFGFAGYLSAVVLGALRLSPEFWEVVRNISFWLHFVIVAALLFLLPFSRFFHVIMSPVIVAYNTMVDQEAQNERLRHRRKMPQAAPGTRTPAA